MQTIRIDASNDLLNRANRSKSLEKKKKPLKSRERKERKRAIKCEKE